MHTPHGGSITASPPALAAGKDPGSPNEGVGGTAEAMSIDAGSAAGLYIGPMMSSLDCVRRLEEVGPSGPLSLIPVACRER